MEEEVGRRRWRGGSGEGRWGKVVKGGGKSVEGGEV